jgi:hypothetical protein
MAEPGREFDEQGAKYLDAVFDGEDTFAAIKAARLIITRAARSRRGEENFSKYLPYIVTLMQEEKAQKTGSEAAASKLWNDFAEGLTYAHDGRYYVESLKDAEQLGRSRNLMRALKASLGYDGENLESAWREGREKDQEEWVRWNVNNILLLEDQEPGLAKKITDTFGIRNFARYSPKMLADMYHGRLNEPEKPYVLGFVARDDHNGALGKLETRNQLAEKLAKHGIRYEEHEVADKEDMRRVIASAQELHELHGSEIVDVLLNAHGTSDHLLLSNHYDGSLDSEDVAFLGGLSSVLRSDARILALSCSAGKEEKDEVCIAQALAQAIGREAVGPTVNSSNRARVHTSNGQARVEARTTSLRSIIGFGVTFVAISVSGIGVHTAFGNNIYADLYEDLAPLAVMGSLTLSKIAEKASTSRHQRTFSPKS